MASNCVNCAHSIDKYPSFSGPRLVNTLLVIYLTSLKFEIDNCSLFQTMLPALSTLINLYDKVEYFLDDNSAHVLAFLNLTTSASFPWISVINPLVIILFVERYRKYMGRIFRGGQGTGTVKPLIIALAQGPRGRFETTGPPVNTTRV